MDSIARYLQYTRRRAREINDHIYVYYRHPLAGRYVHWLASHAPSRCRHICSRAPSLETGKAVGGLAWPWFSASANVISVREGTAWLLLAAVVELPPLVRPAGFLIRLLTQHDSASQVFIYLNLNGNSFFPLTNNEK